MGWKDMKMRTKLIALIVAVSLALVDNSTALLGMLEELEKKCA